MRAARVSDYSTLLKRRNPRLGCDLTEGCGTATRIMGNEGSQRDPILTLGSPFAVGYHLSELIPETETESGEDS